MATKDSIMKQSIFFWVFGHRLSFEYGFKKFLFGAWRNLSGALRELILNVFHLLQVKNSEYDQKIPQTQTANSWHHEEEPHNHRKTPGRQTKQSNRLSLPHQDDCKTRKDIK